MGYAFSISPCLNCGIPFAYNPRFVPSIIDTKTKEKQPVCRDCIARENSDREQEEDPKRPLLTFHPEAYQPINEKELP